VQSERYESTTHNITVDETGTARPLIAIVLFPTSCTQSARSLQRSLQLFARRAQWLALAMRRRGHPKTPSNGPMRHSRPKRRSHNPPWMGRLASPLLGETVRSGASSSFSHHTLDSGKAACCLQTSRPPSQSAVKELSVADSSCVKLAMDNTNITEFGTPIAIETLFRDAYRVLEEIQEAPERVDAILGVLVHCHRAIRNLERIQQNHVRIHGPDPVQDPFQLREPLDAFIATCNAFNYVLNPYVQPALPANDGCLPGPQWNWKRKQVKSMEHEFLDHQRTLSMVLTNAI
jgi:hypothetical protein